MKLVDGEKLKEEIFKWDTAKKSPRGVAFRQELYNLLKDCTLSSAELAPSDTGLAKQAKEDRRKAEAWDKLKARVETEDLVITRRNSNRVDPIGSSDQDIVYIMDKLLAQSEEESRNGTK